MYWCNVLTFSKDPPYRRILTVWDWTMEKDSKGPDEKVKDFIVNISTPYIWNRWTRNDRDKSILSLSEKPQRWGHLFGFSENDSLLYFSENLQGCTLFDQSGLIYCGRLGVGGSWKLSKAQLQLGLQTAWLRSWDRKLAQKIYNLILRSKVW